MCDTFVALSDVTADGSVILAKNSDREPNEAHEVVRPRGHGPPRLRAWFSAPTSTIAQVRRTHAVLLAQAVLDLGC